MVQLSHPYMTTGKTIALTRRIFVSKVMSLLFNMLSRFVIAFLPKSKRLLISCLQSPSAVILEPKKMKSVPHLDIGKDTKEKNVVGEVLLWFWWMVTLRMREGFLEEVALSVEERAQASG